MRDHTENWIVALALVVGLTTAVADYAQGQRANNGRATLDPPVVTVTVPEAVGVQVGPLLPTSLPGDLVGLAPGPAGYVTLSPVKVGVGLQVSGGVLSLVAPYSSRTGRVYGEDLTAQVDGSRLQFTFSRPYLAGSESVMVNGLRQIRDRHYRVEGFPPLGIRFLGTPPAAGDTVVTDYDTQQ